MKKKLMLLLSIMFIIAVAGAIILNLSKSKENIKAISEDNRLKVVATFYPMYLIAENIADQIDGMEVKCLTKLNTGCLHDYQLTTEDMKNISEADVLIINGGGMEGFLEDVKVNYPKLTIIDASKGITLLDNNPHVWLDPELYVRQIENVREGLINYIHENYSSDTELSGIEQKINDNSMNYTNKVSELDNELVKIIDNAVAAANFTGNIPKAVIFHEAFAYLADRVGIPVAYTVPLDSDTSFSAGDIASIIDEVKSDSIRYLFTEQQYSDSIAKQIEEETTAKMYIIDSVVTGDGAKDSYLKAMQSNIEVLMEAISGRSE